MEETSTRSSRRIEKDAQVIFVTILSMHIFLASSTRDLDLARSLGDAAAAAAELNQGNFIITYSLLVLSPSVCKVESDFVLETFHLAHL